MKVLEREVSKRWVKAHLKEHPHDYYLRHHDCPWGVKPYDATLFCGKITWAIEFKVDRRKKFAYTLSELPSHQLSALRAFKNGSQRRSKVVVFHSETSTWFQLEDL